MRTRIKICCLRSAEEARQAIAAGADAIGFVALTPPTARTIPDQEIAGIIAAVPPSIETFVLSAAPTAEVLAARARRTGATTIQILSYLDPAESARLAALAPGLRRVQVIHVEGPEALDLIPVYAPHVHAFLLDSGKPNAPRPSYGGTGLPHDWAVSARFVQVSPLPVHLAGGLAPDNVGQAIRRVRPFGVDLCSGVRTGDHLDPARLAAFVDAVRRTDVALGGVR
ncbi:phosphoribosylanthranilate isomerase [Sphingobium nicotianae]|uniref:N-(5'-phosphoribosyl)anthranilate isomerase n=1 Tax=Sphingobium nicotianae TaxID=2782607 RepID=A0A9X1DDD6_9SPHN|nr:phosphoribosylanthranilate isomerase [Sphingobium nicotianae]MBT2187851.1 phosphoribosylanthranilate isomerase [Sphingobium nicotianae]